MDLCWCQQCLDEVNRPIKVSLFWPSLRGFRFSFHIMTDNDVSFSKFLTFQLTCHREICQKKK